MKNEKNLIPISLIAGWFAISLACAGGLPETSPAEKKKGQETTAASTPPPLPLLLEASGEPISEVTDAQVIAEHWGHYRSRMSYTYESDGKYIFSDIRMGPDGLDGDKIEGTWSFKNGTLTETGGSVEETSVFHHARLIVNPRGKMMDTCPNKYVENKISLVGCKQSDQTHCDWTIYRGSEEYDTHYGVRVLQAGGLRSEVDAVVKIAAKRIMAEVNNPENCHAGGVIIDVASAKNERNGVLEVLYCASHKDFAMNIVASLEKEGATVTHQVYEQTQAPVIIAVGSDSGIH
jgi:hypothetical protein